MSWEDSRGGRRGGGEEGGGECVCELGRQQRGEEGRREGESVCVSWEDSRGGRRGGGEEGGGECVCE